MRVRFLKDRMINGAPKVYPRGKAVKGAILDVSEATGKKWIEQELVEEVKEDREAMTITSNDVGNVESILKGKK